MEMTLSNQAIGSIMMALQNSILKQEDVTEALRGFKVVVNDEGQLFVENPPSVEAPEEEDA
tara:strand:- start:117 stop:299 length:183 start_codon:yes stop_codon:yes gene_type:complete